VVIAVLIILNTLWLNIVYRHQLFLMSLNFIIEYQSHGNSFTQFVYNLFSFISGTEFTIAILILIILLPFRKANSYILVMFVAINTYVMAILKIAFIDPRPSWYTDQIHQLQWKCEYTYGFPSGHCWIILILHEIIWCDIIGTGPYHIFLVEPLIFAVIVPLSRLYLGSHTGDHIVSSLTYGFAIAILYKYRIQ
jgi:membrane-associated phospholipid phosphatase